MKKEFKFLIGFLGVILSLWIRAILEINLFSYSFLCVLGEIATVITSFVHLRKNKNVSSNVKIAWVVLILLFPIIGFIAYIYLGKELQKENL